MSGMWEKMGINKEWGMSSKWQTNKRDLASTLQKKFKKKSMNKVGKSTLKIERVRIEQRIAAQLPGNYTHTHTHNRRELRPRRNTVTMRMTRPEFEQDKIDSDRK